MDSRTEHNVEHKQINMKPICQPTSKEQVQAQRQAKRAAKHKVQDSARQIIEPPPTIEAVISKPPTVDSVTPQSTKTGVLTPLAAAAALTKSREEILAERELKKKAKLAGKQNHSAPVAATSVVVVETNCAIGIVPAVSLPPKVVLSKSERRAKQEAQRLAKSASIPPKPAAKTTRDATAKSEVDTKSIVTVSRLLISIIKSNIFLY